MCEQGKDAVGKGGVSEGALGGFAFQRRDGFAVPGSRWPLQGQRGPGVRASGGGKRSLVSAASPSWGRA